jgi:hypothetical protein
MHFQPGSALREAAQDEVQGASCHWSGLLAAWALDKEQGEVGASAEGPSSVTRDAKDGWHERRGEGRDPASKKRIINTFRFLHDKKNDLFCLA